MKVLGKIFFNYIKKRNWAVNNYNYKGKKEILKMVYRTQKEIQTHLSPNEGVQLAILSKSVREIKGDIAEVGVFQGGSAKILSIMNPLKKIHLFDTFNGLPEKTSKDCRDFKIGEYKCSLEVVKNNLKECKNISFYKGLFEKTNYKTKNEKFSFVHLDVDLYKSTKDCLKFFYSRMNQGGIILTHDYFSGTKNGIYKSFDSFFKDKKEKVLELSDSYAMVVKL